MGTSILFLWLLQWVGMEPLEAAALKAAKAGQLDRAAWMAALASERRKGRRERRSRWQQEQTRLAYFSGHLALRRRRPREAAKWFARSLKKNKLYKKQGYWYLAKAQIAARQYKEAANTYRKMLEEYRRLRTKRKIRNQLTRVLRMAKDWKAYTEHLRPLLSYPSPYGGRRRITWWLAEAYHKMGDLKEASAFMRRYALDYPHRAGAKKAERLLALWTRQKKIKPQPWTKSDRSFRLYRLSRFRPKRALPILKKKIAQMQKQPHHDVIQLEYLKKWLARCYMRMREDRTAIPILETLAKKTRNVSLRREVYKLLGRAYMEVGAFEKGVKKLHKFAEKEPESEAAKRVSYRAIWMAMRLKKYDKARQFMKEYSLIYPEEKKLVKLFRWFQVWTIFREGDYKKAIKAFKAWKRTTRSYKGRRKVTYWLGRSYERMGRWNRAKVYYKRVADVAPLSYYGVLSQHRLYVLDDQIEQHHHTEVCKHRPLPKVKALKRVRKGRKDRKKAYKLRGAILSRSQVGFRTPQPSQKDVRVLHQSLQRTAQKTLPQSAPFPSVPSFCRGATSRSCLAFRRAKVFARLGLDQDAVKELGRARWAIRHSKKRVLESIRWLYSKKGYYHGVMLSFYLLRKPRRAPRLSPEEMFKISYPMAYAPMLLQESQRSGVPFAFAWAITRAESLFRINTRSWADALGLMQIIPKTAYKIADRIQLERFRLRHLYRPTTNIKMGCWYLGQLLTKFQSHVMLTAAAYNAGPHRVAVWLKDHHNVAVDEFVEEIPFTETRRYVRRVFRNYVIYNYLYNRTLPTPPTSVAVRVGQNIDF